MSKCKRCDESGLFLKINKLGLCNDCHNVYSNIAFPFLKSQILSIWRAYEETDLLKNKLLSLKKINSEIEEFIEEYGTNGHCDSDVNIIEYYNKIPPLLKELKNLDKEQISNKVPPIILTFRKKLKGKSPKKLIDNYYSNMNEINKSWKQKDIERTLMYCNGSLPFLEIWIKEEIREFGQFNISSIPAIELGSILNAIFGIRGQLLNYKDIIYYIPQLEYFRKDIDFAFQAIDVVSKIKNILSENPGFLQKNLKKDIEEIDGRSISQIVYYMNVCGLVKKNKKGNSNELFLLDTKD